MIDRIARLKWWLFGLIALGLLAIWVDRRWDRRERSQDQWILAAARQYGVDPALVKAVVWQESRFHPEARGTKGEIGLMQVGELAALEWAAAEKKDGFKHEDLFDPVLNTQAGTWYLAKAIRRYQNLDSPFHYALADYNAGRTHVLRWLGLAGQTNAQSFLDHMDYPSTRHYVESILRQYRRYQRDFPDTSG